MVETEATDAVIVQDDRASAAMVSTLVLPEYSGFSTERVKG